MIVNIISLFLPVSKDSVDESLAIQCNCTAGENIGEWIGPQGFGGRMIDDLRLKNQETKLVRKHC